MEVVARHRLADTSERAFEVELEAKKPHSDPFHSSRSNHAETLDPRMGNQRIPNTAVAEADHRQKPSVEAALEHLAMDLKAGLSLTDLNQSVEPRAGRFLIDSHQMAEWMMAKAKPSLCHTGRKTWRTLLTEHRNCHKICSCIPQPMLRFTRTRSCSTNPSPAHHTGHSWRVLGPMTSTQSRPDGKRLRTESDRTAP